MSPQLSYVCRVCETNHGSGDRTDISYAIRDMAAGLPEPTVCRQLEREDPASMVAGLRMARKAVLVSVGFPFDKEMEFLTSSCVT